MNKYWWACIFDWTNFSREKKLLTIVIHNKNPYLCTYIFYIFDISNRSGRTSISLRHTPLSGKIYLYRACFQMCRDIIEKWRFNCSDYNVVTCMSSFVLCTSYPFFCRVRLLCRISHCYDILSASKTWVLCGNYISSIIVPVAISIVCIQYLTVRGQSAFWRGCNWGGPFIYSLSSFLMERLTEQELHLASSWSLILRSGMRMDDMKKIKYDQLTGWMDEPIV